MVVGGYYYFVFVFEGGASENNDITFIFQKSIEKAVKSIAIWMEITNIKNARHKIKHKRANSIKMINRYWIEINTKYLCLFGFIIKCTKMFMRINICQ